MSEVVTLLQELHRVSSTNLLMAVGTFIGVAALLSQVGTPEDLWNTIKDAHWGWDWRVN